MKKALNPEKLKFGIISPFWKKPGNVGVLRVRRFVRWLQSSRVSVVLIRAGRQDAATPMPWGIEISIRDPLGRSWEDVPGLEKYSQKTLAVRGYKIAAWLLNPDPAALWARRAANHPLVLESIEGASHILSSSPPESSHLCGLLLAEKSGARLITDMRDGWLDEPLKPVLQNSAFRRWREERMEKKILKRANTIFVTSEIWRRKLTERLPFTEKKVSVLTNGYPDFDPIQIDILKNNLKKSDQITLLYAGQFTGSHNQRKPSLLLGPLYSFIKNLSFPGKLILMGKISQSDKDETHQWMEKFGHHGWEIHLKDAVEHQNLIRYFSMVDGLLLLTLPSAQIPAKLFEYIVAKKPILAICPENGAVWNLQNRIPQMYVFGLNEPVESAGRIQAFLFACKNQKYSSAIPPEFSENHLKGIFFSQTGLVRDRSQKDQGDVES